MTSRFVPAATRMFGAVLLFLIFSSQLFAQDYTITMVEDGESETTSIGRTALRYVTADDDIIVRMDQRKYILIDHNEKTYSEMTCDALQQMLSKTRSSDPQQTEAMKKALGWTGESKVTRVGPGDTILGYKTEKYLVTAAMGQMELHVAPSLEVPSSYYEAMKLMEGAAPFSGFAEQMGQIKGLALKQVSSLKMFGDVIESTSIATKVDTSPIPASRFEPPAGYRDVPPAF